MCPARPQLFAGGRALKAEEVESSDDEEEEEQEDGMEEEGSDEELGSEEEEEGEDMSDSEDEEEVRAGVGLVWAAGKWGLCGRLASGACEAPASKSTLGVGWLPPGVWPALSVLPAAQQAAAQPT